LKAKIFPDAAPILQKSRFPRIGRDRRDGKSIARREKELK
jgi:hypothetical protein